MNLFNRETTEEESITEGCEACDNTGLEQGVPLIQAKECPVCHGSPFGVHETELPQVEVVPTEDGKE